MSNEKEKQISKQQNAAFILVVYILFFIILFSLTFNNSKKEDKNSMQVKKNININEILKKLENNNYNYNYILNKDNESFELFADKNKFKEVGYYKVEKKLTPFVINNVNKFTVENEKYIKNNNLNIYGDFDNILLNTENILKILKKREIIKKENYKKTYLEISKIKGEELINLYNQLNYTFLDNHLLEDIEVEIKYGDEILSIEFNLTNYQNIIINSKKYFDSKYILKFKNINKINLNSF